MPPDKTYSRGDESSLPSDDTDRDTAFASTDYTDVATDNNVYVQQSAYAPTQPYSVFLWKNKHNDSQAIIEPNWIGKASLAPSSSTVYLQIYNRDSTTWETLDSDNTTAANTEFTLTGTQDTSLNNYYDASHWVACRVYQEVA